MSRCICSVCLQEFESGTSLALPFCSERCRMIDLRRWFEEGYSMPIERDRELDSFEDPDRRED